MAQRKTSNGPPGLAADEAVPLLAVNLRTSVITEVLCRKAQPIGDKQRIVGQRPTAVVCARDGDKDVRLVQLPCICAQQTATDPDPASRVSSVNAARIETARRGRLEGEPAQA